MLFITSTLSLQAHVTHYCLTQAQQATQTFTWQEEHIEPFDELILSWNARRPNMGEYFIEISLFTHDWSPWSPYANWSTMDQHVYNFQFNKEVRSYIKDSLATGFKVRVTVTGGATLHHFRSLHASYILTTEHRVSYPTQNKKVVLNVPQISQLALDDTDNIRICSPVATTAVLNKMLQGNPLDPLTFAREVYDSRAHIYGVWVLNIAQASHELGEKWFAYAARLNSFDDLIKLLHKGYPIVVSVQGTLSGGAKAYDNGHLLVVRGYDPKKRVVLCMDPAFESIDKTFVAYKIDDFMKAWGINRSGLAYVIHRIPKHLQGCALSTLRKNCCPHSG